MFIEADDYILLMDFWHNLSVIELRRLEAAGIRTWYPLAAIKWDEMQPTENSPVDWSRLDNLFEKQTHTGLKLLIPFLFALPKWMPDDCYFLRADPSIPNYGSQELGASLDAFANNIVRRYQGARFQLIYSLPGSGEFPDSVWGTTNHHPIPGNQIARFVVDRQRVLEAQCGEVWTSFHHYGDPPYMEPIYTALQATYPHSKHYAIQFTHFPHHPHTDQFARVRNWRERYGLTYFVGSEYCGGLVKNTASAIEQGVRFITAPTHPGGAALAGHWGDETKLEDLMLEAIENTCRQMSEAYHA